MYVGGGVCCVCVHVSVSAFNANKIQTDEQNARVRNWWKYSESFHTKSALSDFQLGYLLNRNPISYSFCLTTHTHQTHIQHTFKHKWKFMIDENLIGYIFTKWQNRTEPNRVLYSTPVDVSQRIFFLFFFILENIVKLIKRYNRIYIRTRIVNMIFEARLIHSSLTFFPNFYSVFVRVCTCDSVCMCVYIISCFIPDLSLWNYLFVHFQFYRKKPKEKKRIKVL